jgi:hypothetical protein
LGSRLKGGFVGLAAGLSLLLAACNTASGETPAAPVSPVLGWDRDPSAIVVRLDRINTQMPEQELPNMLPPCTLYGNGRVVWVNSIPPNGEEVLEAYVDDVTIRNFLEFIIRDQKFYSVPDYAAQELPPESALLLESITLNLSDQVRTVRNYRSWADDLYPRIRERCVSLTDVYARFVPQGAWVTFIPLEARTDAPEAAWSLNAPFRLADTTNQAVWVTGPALAELWDFQRQTGNQGVWVEVDRPYRAVIQVPDISRDSPPAPGQTPEQTPQQAPSATPAS